MIDEKKLEEDVKKYFAKLKAHNVHELVELFFEDIIGIIDEQPKLSLENKTSDKWIPCSERLPKQNEHIIGTFKNINEGSNLVFGVNFYHDLLNEPMPLIAWMPLPEIYRGKNEKYY